MALSRARPNEVPKDAVILSEDEALKYHWTILSKWEKLSEVWSLRYGPGLLMTFAAGTGIFVNNYYRRKLKLGTYGRLTTYLPIVVLPAMLSLMSHKLFVQRYLLLEPMQGCPTCLQLRAAAFQTFFGVIYPTMLAPLAACMFASRHFTYRLPSMTENPLEVLQLLRKFTKPIYHTLGSLLIVQSLTTIYLTYKQQEQNFKVIINLKKFEQQVEQELGL